MVVIEAIAFILVFAAICIAYDVGRSNGRAGPHRGLRQIGQYVPPIPVVLEYRNATGLKTLQRINVFRSLSGRDGSLYLFGFHGKARKPKTFRMDRVICIATMDGEIIDTRRFLTEWLAIPPDQCAAGGRRPG